MSAGTGRSFGRLQQDLLCPYMGCLHIAQTPSQFCPVWKLETMSASGAPCSFQPMHLNNGEHPEDRIPGTLFEKQEEMQQQEVMNSSLHYASGSPFKTINIKAV